MTEKQQARRESRKRFHEEVVERDQGRCRICGKRASDAHHILYRSQGGTDDLDNGILLCRTDHERVHAEGGRKWRPILREMAQTPSYIRGSLVGRGL